LQEGRHVKVAIRKIAEITVQEVNVRARNEARFLMVLIEHIRGTLSRDDLVQQINQSTFESARSLPILRALEGVDMAFSVVTHVDRLFEGIRITLLKSAK
jgi:hypothetical protein